MPVWRDDWQGKGQVVVIAPRPPQQGEIRHAIVLLNEAQTEPIVTLTDSLGQPITVALPPDLLDGERRNVETTARLKILRSHP